MGVVPSRFCLFPLKKKKESVAFFVFLFFPKRNSVSFFLFFSKKLGSWALQFLRKFIILALIFKLYTVNATLINTLVIDRWISPSRPELSP